MAARRPQEWRYRGCRVSKGCSNAGSNFSRPTLGGLPCRRNRMKPTHGHTYHGAPGDWTVADEDGRHSSKDFFLGVLFSRA